MKYTVYHAINPTFGFGERPKFPTEYKKVAIVEATDLEDAFRVTNHIDHDWRKNSEILETIGDKFRSTSVGDIVVDENKEIFYCDMVGWKNINKEMV